MRTFILYYERVGEVHRSELKTTREVEQAVNRLIDNGVDITTIVIYNDVGANCTKYFIDIKECE